MMIEKKTASRKLLLIGLLLGFLFAAVLLAPRLISTEGFKGRIQSVFQQQTGGHLDYQSAAIIFFPRPGIVLEKVQVTLPDRLEGKVDSLSLSPQVMPLLRGQVRLSGLGLVRPELSVVMPADMEPTKAENPPASIVNLPETLAPVIKLLASYVPQLDVNIDQGHVTLSRQGLPWLELQKLDLELSSGATSTGSVTAGLDGNIGVFRLQQGAKELQLEGADIAGTAHFEAGELQVSLAKLSLNQPALQLSGTLAIKSATPAVSLELQGKDVDVDATRKLALTLAGENVVVANIFDYLRGGTVKEIRFSGHGKDFAELGALPQIRIQGRLMDGAVSIPAIKMDLAAVNGDVTISDGVLTGEGLSTRLDESTGRDGQLKIDLSDTAGPFHLDLQVDADLRQLQQILGGIVDDAAFITELQQVTHIKGRAAGRLTLGESLDNLTARVAVKELNFSADYQPLPFPASISQGQFSFAEEHIEMTNLAGKVGASRFSDVALQLDWKEQFLLKASSGHFWLDAAKLYPWLNTFTALQGPLSWLHQPSGELQFVTTGLNWQSEGGFAVKGKLVLPRGPEVTADLTSAPDRLQIRQLDIHDQGSQANLTLDLQRRELVLGFSGQLRQKTLRNMFLAADSGDGLLQGDFKLKTTPGQPEKAIAHGELKAENIPLPLVMNEPLKIRKLDLGGRDRQIMVNAAALIWGENEVALQGRVDLASSGLVLDLAAEAGALEWAAAQQVTAESPVAASQQESWTPAISGDIRLKAKSFTLKGLTWEPVQADITLKPEQTDIRIDRADLCGISSPGTLVIKGKQLDLDFKVSAKDQEIGPRYACLTNNRVQMTGTFDLDGQISADGTADTLLQNAKGNFLVEAHDGQITEDKTLARTLEVINVTEIVKGKLPDLKKAGFEYNSMSVEAELKGEKLLLKKYQMNGKTLDLLGQGTIDLASGRIDAQLMAAPFKTVDSVIKYIPGVNYLLAGSLVAIPVSIQGGLHDPKVKIMNPSAVGSGLLGLAERVVKAPVKLIESALPEEKNP